MVSSTAHISIDTLLCRFHEPFSIPRVFLGLLYFSEELLFHWLCLHRATLFLHYVDLSVLSPLQDFQYKQYQHRDAWHIQEFQ